MDFLRNLAVNLRATGPAAVVAVWFICLTIVGIFGPHSAAIFAVGILGVGGITVLLALLKSDAKSRQPPRLPKGFEPDAS